jgi:hypothetical protein
MDPIVTLDVGGKIFRSAKSTLVNYSDYFRAMISRFTHEDYEKTHFIDKSPENFYHILEKLRDPRYNVPYQCFYDLEYFQITLQECQTQDDSDDDSDHFEEKKERISLFGPKAKRDPTHTVFKQRKTVTTQDIEHSFERLFKIGECKLSIKSYPSIARNFALYGPSNSIRSVLENLKYIEILDGNEPVLRIDGDWVRASMLLRGLQVKYTDACFYLGWLIESVYFVRNTALVFVLEPNQLNVGCKLIYSIATIQAREYIAFANGYHEFYFDTSKKYVVSTEGSDIAVISLDELPRLFEVVPTMICIEAKDSFGNHVLAVRSIEIKSVLEDSGQTQTLLSAQEKDMLVRDKVIHKIRNVDAPLYTFSISARPTSDKILSSTDLQLKAGKLYINLKEQFKQEKITLKAFFAYTGIQAIEENKIVNLEAMNK